MSDYDSMIQKMKDEQAVQKSLEVLFESVVKSIEGMIEQLQEAELKVDNLIDAQNLVQAKIDKDLLDKANSVDVKDVTTKENHSLASNGSKALDNAFKMVGDSNKIVIRIARFVDNVSVFIYLNPGSIRWS